MGEPVLQPWATLMSIEPGTQKSAERGGGGGAGGGGDGGGGDGGGLGGIGGGGAQRPLSPANIRLRPVQVPLPLYDTVNVASM